MCVYGGEKGLAELEELVSRAGKADSCGYANSVGCLDWPWGWTSDGDRGGMRPTLRAEGGMGCPKELGIDVGQGAGGDGGRCEVPEGELAGRGEACLDAEVLSK